MAIVSLEKIMAILSVLIQMDGEPSEKRSVFFDNFNLYDIVPEECQKAMIRSVSLCYDSDGDGYHGILKEIWERTSFKYACGKWVLVEDYKLHSLGKRDIWDSDNRQGIEVKTGCGNWLYSKNKSFSATVRNYSRRKELIRWKYTFDIESKKHGKETFRINIETSWRRLFAFLSDFDGGFATWWKENARSGESGMYIWEMQTIRTSRKKALYLLTFDDWDKNH